MFCPALGIPEDPVSGNAHGLLGVYLAEHGLISSSTSRASPSAASRVTSCIAPAAWMWSSKSRDGAIDGVWIIGQAVSIFETEISL